MNGHAVCASRGDGCDRTDELDAGASYFLHAPELRIDRWRRLNRIARELADGTGPSTTEDPAALLGELGTKEVITFMRKLDVKEVHGYVAEKGLELLRPEALAKHRSATGKAPAGRAEVLNHVRRTVVGAPGRAGPPRGESQA